MTKPLTDFRLELRDRLLDLAWRQWTSLGVQGRVEPWSESIIDPEALLLFTCAVGRHDSRLFDGVQEWLEINGQFINVQRLTRIGREERFSGESVLRALAAATTTSANQAKWARLAAQLPSPPTPSEPLFYLESGCPLPVVREPDARFAEYGFLRDSFDPRGVAETFRPERTANMTLRLRALLGVNARCEVFSYLLVNRSGSPRAMASDCYFFPATVAKTMDEMERSGFLISRTQGRRRLYTLTPDTWERLFLGEEPRPKWVVWPRLFSALDRIWLLISDPDLGRQSIFEQASSLRRLLIEDVVSQLERGRPGFVFGDVKSHPGEALTAFFIDRIRALLEPG